MEDFTISAEDRGTINIEVEQNTPNVSLLPSDSPIEVSPSVSESPSVDIVHSQNPVNVQRVTRDLYILDQEDLDKVQSVESLNAIEIAKKAYNHSVEAINIANNAMQFAGTLRVYTLEEYNALKQAGRLENKMYCIYTNGILTRIYIYRTLIAKRAKEGQIATGSTFPIIFPIIFA